MQIIQELLKILSKYSYVQVISNIKKTGKTALGIETVKTKNMLNRDMLPIGSTFIGTYRKIPTEIFECKINERGDYVVNNKIYKSLSDAATSVTGVRMDGWRFWKIKKNGPSVLDKFRNKKI